MASEAHARGWKRRGRPAPEGERTKVPVSEWTLERVRDEYMVAVVRHAGGGQEAARILGIDRRALRIGLERRLKG